PPCPPPSAGPGPATLTRRPPLRRCSPSGCGPSTAPTRPSRRARATSMRAVTIDDGRLLLAERPDPEPGRGELLVRVAAAGINGADLAQVRGVYPAPPGSPPDILGLEPGGGGGAGG